MGVLFGKKNRDGRKVKCKKLILFHQTGDSSNCALTSEGELQLGETIASSGDYEAAIGLIHTHPQHGLFLSSIDQHNLYKFQVDVDYAVSFVYSCMISFLFFLALCKIYVFYLFFLCFFFFFLLFLFVSCFGFFT